MPTARITVAGPRGSQDDECAGSQSRSQHREIIVVAFGLPQGIDEDCHVAALSDQVETIENRRGGGDAPTAIKAQPICRKPRFKA